MLSARANGFGPYGDTDHLCKRHPNPFYSVHVLRRIRDMENEYVKSKKRCQIVICSVCIFPLPPHENFTGDVEDRNISPHSRNPLLPQQEIRSRVDSVERSDFGHAISGYILCNFVYKY